MKYRFADIEDGSSIILMLHTGSVHTKLIGSIINLIREDIATITLETSVHQVLKFDNIDISMVYVSDIGTPYIWKKVKIVYFKNNYVLQVKGDGTRYNRRVNYRVSISHPAKLYTVDDREFLVTVNDVSLNGFSVKDTESALDISVGDGARICFTDINHNIDLYGIVMRVEDNDESKVYGFKVRRSCRDLPSYITSKLEAKGNKLPPSYVI